MQIFGWKLPSGGRRIRKVLLWIPKKNGKTTLAAALALYMLAGSGEEAPRVYCVAATTEQGEILYNEVESMVSQDRVLKDRVFPFPSKRLIKAPRKGEMFLLAAKVPKRLDGKNVYAAFIDEYWVQANRTLFDILSKGTAGRSSGGLTMVLSTTGDTDEGPLLKLVELGRNLLDPDGGFVDMSFLPVLYFAPDELAWDSKEAVAAANPSFNVTVKWDYYSLQLPEARVDKVAQSIYERKHLNRFGGTGVGYFNMVHWDECRAGIDEEVLLRRPCCGGLDGGWSSDFGAFVLLFDRGDGGYYIKPYFFIPEDNIRAIEQHTSQPISQWVDHGLIDAAPGRVVTDGYVENRIIGLADRYELGRVGYDPYKLIQMSIRLRDEHGIDMIEVPQNFLQLGDPTAQFKTLIAQGLISHDGNPVLRWMMKCCKVIFDNHENPKLTKPRRDEVSDRIDGPVGGVMSLKMMLLYDEPEKGSIYVGVC